MTGLRKRYVFLATAMVLIGLLTIPSVALAGKRIQDEGRGTVSMDSVGDAPEQATAVAKFDLDSSDGGWYRVQMKIRIQNLPQRAGRVFETWWRDSNREIDDSVGAFQTDRNGDGGFTVTKRVVFFAPFDEILVTSERRNDSDPTRNGPVLLRGQME